MITARNYAAKAVRDLELISKTLSKEEKEDGYIVSLVAKEIEKSQHFVMPDGGKILDTHLSSLSGLPARLPYKSISIEFFQEEIKGQKGKGPLKFVILAMESQENLDFINKITMKSDTKDLLDENVNRGSLFIAFCYENNANLFQGSRRFVLHPHAVVIPRQWESPESKITDVRIRRMATPILRGVVKRMSSAGEYDINNVHVDTAFATMSVLYLCEALSCSNVSTRILEAVDLRVNRKRVAKGKLPLYETKLLVVPSKPYSNKEDAEDPDGIKRNSPREHLRRGHIRRLDEHRRIWINSCVVGNHNDGRIDKTYLVLGE